MTSKNESKLIKRIKDFLETLRVYINADGGDIEFVSFENKVVTIKILGACVGCPFIATTFDDGVKQILLTEFKGQIDDVKFI